VSLPATGPVLQFRSAEQAPEETAGLGLEAPPLALVGADATFDVLITAGEAAGEAVGVVGDDVVVVVVGDPGAVAGAFVLPHAVTPRLSTARARKVGARRVLERFMTVPSGGRGTAWLVFLQ